MKNKRGFTLIEVIVVVAVLGILSAIVIPKIVNYQKTAKIGVLKNNTTELMRLFSLYSVNYSKSDWYGHWSDDGDGTLNNFMEQELEIVVDGTYSNNSKFYNPYSKKKSILDYDRTLSSGDGFCPVVFMTSSLDYSYDATGSTQNIIGTIVAYFNVSSDTTEYIDFYFVDGDGEKSDFNVRLE